jgi:RNA polymerase sigma-B factor
MPSSPVRAQTARTRDDLSLFRRYRRTRDPRQREQLIERFLPLARTVAQRFSGRADDFDDLLQVASLGLIKAVDRFDPEQGSAFSTFAVPTVAGEIKRYLRDRTWAVRPPRDLLEVALRVKAADDHLTEANRRRPTVAEIAAHLGDVDEEGVLEARYAHLAQRATSLEVPVGHDAEPDTLGDRIGRDEPGFVLAEHRTLLDQLLRGVGERERAILNMRFVEDRTQAEIGAELGVSQMQVSRLLRGAIGRLQIVAEGAPQRDAQAA